MDENGLKEVEEYIQQRFPNGYTANELLDEAIRLMEEWNLDNQPPVIQEECSSQMKPFHQAIVDLLKLCEGMNVTRDPSGYICFRESPDTPPTYQEPWTTVEDFAQMHSNSSAALTSVSADAEEWASLIDYLKHTYNDDELKPVERVRGVFAFDNGTLVVADTAGGGYHFMSHAHALKYIGDGRTAFNYIPSEIDVTTGRLETPLLDALFLRSSPSDVDIDAYLSWIYAFLFGRPLVDAGKYDRWGMVPLVIGPHANDLISVVSAVYGDHALVVDCGSTSPFAEPYESPARNHGLVCLSGVDTLSKHLPLTRDDFVLLSEGFVNRRSGTDVEDEVIRMRWTTPMVMSATTSSINKTIRSEKKRFFVIMLSDSTTVAEGLFETIIRDELSNAVAKGLAGYLKYADAHGKDHLALMSKRQRRTLFNTRVSTLPH